MLWRSGGQRGTGAEFSSKVAFYLVSLPTLENNNDFLSKAFLSTNISVRTNSQYITSNFASHG